MKCWKSLDTTQRDVEEYMDKVELKKGWLTKYNRRHNFSSPFRLDGVLEDWSRYQHEVVLLMKSARDALAEVFDHYTQSEWIEQKVYPPPHLPHLKVLITLEDWSNNRITTRGDQGGR